MKKKKERGSVGPVFTLFILTILVMLASLILSVIGFEGNAATINNDAIETYLVTVRNIFSKEGLQFLVGNIQTNFHLFEPLVVLIISLIGIGIGEKSGLFQAIFSPLKGWKSSRLTMVTLFFSIIASFLGENIFAFLIPLAGVIYKYAGKNSRLGIITTFLGFTVGYGTSLLGGYTDYLLGIGTDLAAKIGVDKTYTFHMISNLYLMIGSVLILTIVGTVIVEKRLTPKFSKKTPLLEEELPTSKKGLFLSGAIIALYFFILLYGIVPKIPGGGFLLDKTQTNYFAALLGSNSPFGQSYVFLIVFLLLIIGCVYGVVSKNIKSSNDYSIALSKSFEGTGYAFVLMFFAAEMIAILDWTNLGVVLSARLTTFLSSLQFSGVPLIISFFFIVILMTFLVPNTEAKWTYLHPIIIPLFMRSNITPDFTQFVFRAADGIGKCITPFFGYYTIFLAFLQKYNYDETHEITVFGTLKKIMPAILLFILLWLLILIGWFMIGLPMGPGVTSTL